MNYGVQRAAVEYFAKSAVAPQRFQELLTENLMRYSDAANDSMLNLLDSHDTARFLTVSGGNTARLKNAAAFLFTFVGMPCTYYGTEIGMTGENDRIAVRRSTGRNLIGIRICGRTIRS